MEQLTGARLELAAPLFSSWNETMIWSCLQGCMGSVFVDDAEAPRTALAVLGDFGFLAGEPNAAIASHLAPFSSEGALLVPQNAAWAALIEAVHAGKLERFVRYAFHKDASAFDTAALHRFANALPPEYALRPIDEALHHALLHNSRSCGTLDEPCLRDLCSQLPAWPDFSAHGLGFVALCGAEIAAGASTYSWFGATAGHPNGGIELEVDTASAHRRRGLARACAARLMLECLERGLFPSWDAANLESAALAQQLGYRLDGEYITYAVQNASP